jgi:hypothetical protein
MDAQQAVKPDRSLEATHKIRNKLAQFIWTGT